MYQASQYGFLLQNSILYLKTIWRCNQTIRCISFVLSLQNLPHHEHLPLPNALNSSPPTYLVTLTSLKCPSNGICSYQGLNGFWLNPLKALFFMQLPENNECHFLGSKINYFPWTEDPNKDKNKTQVHSTIISFCKQKIYLTTRFIQKSINQISQTISKPRSS